MTEQLRAFGSISKGTGPLDFKLLDQAARTLMRNFDPVHGGFGRAPKFPHPMDLRVLLRHHLRTGDDQALHVVRHTLRKMAQGGIYDHLGGGFARYSTDERWLVPHFEKMLYDNALLSSTLPGSLAGDRRSLVPPGRPRNDELRSRPDDRRPWRIPFDRGCRQRRRRRQILRLVAGRSHRTCWVPNEPRHSVMSTTSTSKATGKIITSST